MPNPPTTPQPPPSLLTGVRRQLDQLLRAMARVARHLGAALGTLRDRLGNKQLESGPSERPSRPDHPAFSPARPTRPPVSLGESPTSAAEKPREGPGIAQPSGERVLVGSVRAQLLLRSVQHGDDAASAPPTAASPAPRAGAEPPSGAARPGTAPARKRPSKS